MTVCFHHWSRWLRVSYCGQPYRMRCCLRCGEVRSEAIWEDVSTTVLVQSNTTAACGTAQTSKRGGVKWRGILVRGII